MVKGIGIDLIEVERVKKTAEKNPKFLERIFTPHEVSYCQKKETNTNIWQPALLPRKLFLKQ